MADSCAQYVSADDLKAAKESILHIEHVATSKDANGDPALVVTDPIRGVGYTNATLDGLFSGIGFKPVNGSFEDGGTLVNRWDVLLYETNGNFYQWLGTLPRSIPAGSSPFDSSGSLLPGWVDQSDLTLRGELNSVNGFNLIKSPGGQSLKVLYNNDLRAVFGAKPDYTGTPLYDGNDASRITATDNTPMLLSALTNGIVRNDTMLITVPAGHYGFKTGHINKTAAELGFKNLIILGAGKGISILDFIHENTDNTDHSDQGTDVDLLLYLTGFDSVTFQDITTKCTTNIKPVGGTSNVEEPAVYHGAVWFAHMQDCKKVNFIDHEMCYANYRGMSVDGRGLPLYSRTEVLILNCEGHNCTSTGYWTQFCNTTGVEGGEYYHNGTRGYQATGYGVAASKYVDHVWCRNAHFYENFRKGLDRHGGLGSMIVENCVFADNILYDIYDNNNYIAQYPSDVMNFVQVSHCDFIIGRNKAWLSDALSAITSATSMQKMFVVALDQGGPPANAQVFRNARVSISHCNFKVFNNPDTKWRQFLGIIGQSQELRFEKNNVELSRLSLEASAQDVYSRALVTNGWTNPSNVILKDNNIQMFDGYTLTSGAPSNGMLLQHSSNVNSQFIIEDNVFDIKNWVLLGSTGAGLAQTFAGSRKINGNTFKLRDLQLNTFGVSTTNAFAWLSGFYMFGTYQPSSFYGGTNSIGIGDCECIYEYKFGAADTVVDFKVPPTKLTTGTPLEIITGNTGGNLHLTLTGKAASAGDTLAYRWLNSANTPQVVTASSVLSSGALSDYTFTHNGNPTNFVGKKITVSTSSNLAGTQFYVGELSAVDSYSPKFLGFSI